MIAYSESGKEFQLNVTIKGEDKKIICFYGPCSYYIADFLIRPLRSHTLFFIDGMGRNFGTKFGDGVFVQTDDIIEFLEAHVLEYEDELINYIN